MAQIDEAQLDFAYKYPFSSAARQIIAGTGAAFDPKALKDGAMRVQRAVDNALEFQPISLGAIKLTYLISYVYARMVASAIKSPVAISQYARAEAQRAALALRDGPDTELAHLASELGFEMASGNGGFSVPFEQYLQNLPRREKFALPRQRLRKGRVYLTKELAAGLLESRIRREVLKGLPIPSKELPAEVIEQARGIRIPASPKSAKGKDTGTRYLWIEKLIETPIPDFRHRSVNLILAPYLMNVKGMSEDEAVKIIEAYIERCKQVEPNTKVNASYIRYQCRYAKNKGMRPLSTERARELIGSFIEI